MYKNEGLQVDIVPLHPTGTNSTFFTQCCYVAICDYEGCCPKCGQEVVGANLSSRGARDIARWKNATRHWERKPNKEKSKIKRRTLNEN